MYDIREKLRTKKFTYKRKLPAGGCKKGNVLYDGSRETCRKYFYRQMLYEMNGGFLSDIILDNMK